MNDEVTANIMVVDDTPTNLKLLDLLLKSSRYTVSTYTRGAAALEAAKERPPDIVLLDVSMPEMDGYEVCGHFKSTKELQEIPVLFISAHTEPEEKVKAFESGGVDYITKPFHAAEVKARVGTHLKLAQLQATLHRQNENLESMVADQVEEIYSAQLSTIVALAKLAEYRDNDTGKHLERVQLYTRLLAEELQKANVYSEVIHERFVTDLFYATPLHDIGKVAIPDYILLKPGKLESDEFEIMKTHAEIGAATLAEARSAYDNNAFLSTGIAITRSHHERWDGTGYPDGIAGTAIPLEARIMAVADVYDALRSKRVYKPAFPHDAAMQIIRDGSGTQFDPSVVHAIDILERNFQQISETIV